MRLPHRGAWHWLPLALLPLLALLSEYSGLDLIVADAFRDPPGDHWRWGDAWWSNQLLHEDGRALVKAIAVAALLCALASLRVAALRPFRRATVYLALCIALGTGLTNVTKTLSNVDCPWSLQQYGGERPYVHVFADRPDTLPVARCFPAGHAAGGYSLLGLYFIAVAMRRRRPALWLLPGIATGLLFGFGQWARGAHFVSHDLWSAATCWLVASVLHRFVFTGVLHTSACASRLRRGLAAARAA